MGNSTNIAILGRVFGHIDQFKSEDVNKLIQDQKGNIGKIELLKDDIKYGLDHSFSGNGGSV